MEKPAEELLARIAPDRRKFVQSILGLAGYGTPVVRSFIMASAVVPAFAGPAVTTTAAPTTTPNAWRPTPRSTTSLERPSIANPHPIDSGGGDLLNAAEASEIARLDPGGEPFDKPNSSHRGGVPSVSRRTEI